ncbi:response regulator [Glycomyces buryatensis]|uniref:Response regulator transcription factor n=1 Tax=Glycomyces buryatensis TaxID=2570927 RepID=A0A4S8QBU0_9ACTN|nr:response regulator transcription factor [Glycomyces buryatensis]THV41750.1 response regulator transcription factor [Glycomyces buryatensis]
MPIKVLLADDHAAVRAGLRMLLDSADDIEVVAEAADGFEAVELARSVRPDVVVMDIRMPRQDGIAAAAELRGVTDVLILTSYGEEANVFDALRAGASGFLLKDADAETLVDAVRVVARGDGLISPAVTRGLIAEFARARPAYAPIPVDGDGLASLTPREREVLALISEGLANAEIAAQLGMAEATVKSHVTHLLAKLGLSSRVQAAIFAREQE